MPIATPFTAAIVGLPSAMYHGSKGACGALFSTGASPPVKLRSKPPISAPAL